MTDEELDAVPWDSLHHAYGPATDVPDLLRLLRHDAQPVEGAPDPIYELFGNIWHQHTVYEATSYAVPFLLDLAVDRRTPRRVDILNLLGSIAEGVPPYHYGALLGDELHLRSHEVEHVARAHRAVADGLDALIELTKEDDVSIRLAAAQVLSLLNEHVHRVVPLLLDLFNAESGPLHRAGLILLIGRMVKISEEARARVLESADSTDRLERVAALYCIARKRIEPVSASHRAAIVALSEEGDISGEFAELPWDCWPEVADELLPRYLT